MANLVYILRTKRIQYAYGLQLQNYIAEGLKAYPESHEKNRNVLIITEHEPVYTVGIRTYNYTIKDEERLRSLGAQFFKTNRGGLITFHGPGQLVAYPILNLKKFTPSMRWYIQRLEKTIIEVCRQLDINASTSSDTGVWVNENKICAIGVHGSRYITTHGLALNCSTDLEWFSHIVPCGIENKGVTSLSKELGTYVDTEKIIPIFLKCFENAFNCKTIQLTECDEAEIFNT